MQKNITDFKQNCKRLELLLQLVQDDFDTLLKCNHINNSDIKNLCVLFDVQFDSIIDTLTQNKKGIIDKLKEKIIKSK